MIPSVISDCQSAFISERQILDGVLVANEAMYWSKKYKQRLMLFKADFAKAFDCLNWDFLDSILKQMKFGEKWRQWIRSCISSARISVLVNGSPTNQSTMERGLRQGDPLSPFLFIIAVEAINVMLCVAVRVGLYKPASLLG